MKLNVRGQTMIEVIIAIGIIAVGLFGTIAVIVTSVRAGRVAADRLTAMSLAREGIEIARNIRDSNWLAQRAWDTGIKQTSGRPVAFPRMNMLFNDPPTATSLYFPSVAADWNYWGGLNCGSALPIPGTYCSSIYLNGSQYNQLYLQGSKTQFSRLLYLNAICQDAAGDERIVDYNVTATCGLVGSTVETYPTKVGVRVISKVRWPNITATAHEVILEERLYDWRWF